MQWYQEINPGEPISQGDIFFNVPIISIDVNTVDLSNLERIKEQELGIDLKFLNVVVISQACDLQQGKLSDIIVSEIADISTIELAEGVSRWNFIADVYSGNRPNLILIGNHTSQNRELEINYQLVDFTSVYTLPLSFLNVFKENHGVRLRLNTPHREMVSQQFGNFMSRIGLPNEDFIKKEELRKIIKDLER